MRRLNRILTVVVCCVFVAAGWSLVSHTARAAAREYLGAGLDFDHWSDPLIVLGAMVLVAVTATKLIERMWKALFPERVRPARTPGRATRTPAMPDAA